MGLTAEAIIALVGVLLGLPAVGLLFWKLWRRRQRALRNRLGPGPAQGKPAPKKKKEKKKITCATGG